MFALLAAAHATVLLTTPTATVIALGVWWNANTIAHNFIHRPFFRQPVANQAFAAALSVLNGIPQSIWRDRHLAHHGGVARPAFSREAMLQSGLVVSVWAAIAAHSPRFFFSTYLPGYLAGLALCALHGYYEHARGTTSYYGRLYNVLLFNDGYHVEHHANPGVPWHELPARRSAAAVTSRWPAPLRWLERAGLAARGESLASHRDGRGARPARRDDREYREYLSEEQRSRRGCIARRMQPDFCHGLLDSLERLVLRSSALQRFVLTRHARAWQHVLPSFPASARLTIVGGGLFPRSALIARQLMPAVRITIVDASSANLQQARRLVGSPGVEFVHERYAGLACEDCDLLVIPLSFDGDRHAIYEHPPAAAVLVHDWIWRRRGTSCIVSIALLKRVNVLRRPQTE